MPLNHRRLLKDHSALQAPPPPDFFLPDTPPSGDDLTTITLHLLGPTSTPFENGLFSLVLKLPSTYPTNPPKATFRTKIFHPNICDRTGDVCVDTLKREWNDKLTLKDVCIVIRCLLVEPNPTSSLNEEAGKMMNEEWRGWERRARLWTKVHATTPESMKEMVEQVRRRDSEGDDCVGKGKAKDREEKKGKDEKTVDKSTAGAESNVPRIETAMTIAASRRLATGAKKQKSANVSHTQSQKRTNSATPPCPTATPNKAEATEKDRDRSVEKDCANQGDENAELENTPGKENAVVPTIASTSTFNSALSPSRATSPVKSQTPPPALVALPGISVPTATSSLPPTSAPPAPQTSKSASSLVGKKRPSGDDLNPAHESAVPSKTKVAKLAAISSTKVSPTSKLAHIKSSSSSSSSSSLSSSSLPSTSLSKAGMKKKVTGTAAPTIPKVGTQVQARKGLKRF